MLLLCIIFFNVLLTITICLLDKYFINGRKIQIFWGSNIKRRIKKCAAILNSEKLFITFSLLICLCNAAFLYDNAIWGDEGFSAILVRRNITGILAGTAADVHPPLYYLFLKLMVTIFGEQGIVLHLTSFIPFLCCCLIIMIFVRKKFGMIPAYIAMILTGWTGMGMVYSVEIRMYSMALLFVTMTFCIAYEVLEKENLKYWVYMAFFALLAAYTHYFALIEVAFLILAVFVVAIIKKQKKVYKKIIITAVICMMGYLPWLTSLLITVKHTIKGFWLQTVPPFSESMDLTFGMMNYSRGLYIGLAILLIVKVTMQIITIKREEGSTNVYIEYTPDSDNNVIMAWIAVWTILATIIFGTVFSKLIRPVMLTRYLFPMTAMAGISLGIMLQYYTKRKKIGKIVKIAAIFLILFMSIVGMKEYAIRYDKYRLYRDGTAETISVLDKDVDEGYCIVSDIDHFNWTILEYYYPQMHENYYELFEGDEPNKVVALLQNEISDEDRIQIESLGYEISNGDSGRLDDTLCYIYYFEKNRNNQI